MNARYLRAIACVATVSYALLLSLIYVDKIQPLFAYMGYSRAWPDMDILVACFVMASLPSLVLPLKSATPSAAFLWILYMVVVIPMSTIPLLAFDVGYQYLYLVVLTNALFVLAVMVLAVTPRIDMGRGFGVPSQWRTVLSVLLVVFCAVILVRANFRINLSITQVYDTRAQYKQELAQGSSFGMGYLMGMAGNFLAPFLLALGVGARRMRVVALALILQVLLFGITGFKSFLFAPALFAAVYAVIRSPFGVSLIPVGSLALVITAELADRAFSSIWFTSVAVRRLLITPGFLSGAYFSEYSASQPIAYAQAFMRNFVADGLPMDYRNLISSKYFGHVTGYANVNAFMDAYVNLGLVGIAVVWAVILMILLAADSIAGRLQSPAVVALLVVPLFTVTNTSLFTSLLSHGLLAGILILAVSPRGLFHRPELVPKFPENT